MTFLECLCSGFCLCFSAILLLSLLALNLYKLCHLFSKFLMAFSVPMMVLLMQFLGLISIPYWGPSFGIFICSFVSCSLVRFNIRVCPVVGVLCCPLIPRFSFQLPSSILIFSCKVLYFNSIKIIFNKKCGHITSNMVHPSRCIRYNCWLKCCLRL